MANTKITNHIVDKTLITGQTAVTAADGDYLLVADASDSSALKKVLASDLIQTSEEVADIVGAMVSSNTESGITVAYEDSDNTLDFTIGTLNQNTTGSAATLTTARTIGGTSFDGSANIAVGLAATATALATSRTIHGVGFDGTANIDLSEVISDTVGAMFSSNTETNITVTYQDSDNTIDLVVDAAQPNITSLGTLTSLTVDDITINGSTISDASDLTLDVGGDIILDADGADFRYKDAGTEFLRINNGASGPVLLSPVSDKDIVIKGNDGGSEFTALTLDMSNGGRANFNNDIGLNDDRGIRLGSDDDSVIYNDGSNLYIKNSTSNHDIIFQGNDDGSAITAMTIDMSDAGKAIFNAGATFANRVEFNYNGDYQLKIDNGSSEPWYQRVQSDGTFALHLNGTGNIFHATSTGTTTTGLHTSTQSANITQVAITSSSNAVAWDARAAANAYHVTTENTTFSAPSNAVEGALISVEIAQGGTARTIAWNTVFEFAASTAPTITATANKTDILAFRYNGSVWQEIGRVQNMAQS